jgi:hypothetical protein
MLQAIAVLPAAAERRVALVIGNSAYVNAGMLRNPVNDASDLAKVLAKFGFGVTLGLDLTRRAFEEKVQAFSRTLADADTAILFYAGHGLQVAGHNYLLPVDAALVNERDLDFETIPLDFVLKQMEVGRDGKTNILFLDACRNNPLARNLARTMGTRSASVGRGLAEVQTGVGTFIAYSTQPGNVALDGEGRNSPFAAAFVTRVQESGRNLTTIMINVRKDVLAATGGRQVPWDHSALTGEFYFQPAAFGPEKDGTPAEARVQVKQHDALAAAPASAPVMALSGAPSLAARERMAYQEGKLADYANFTNRQCGTAMTVTFDWAGASEKDLPRYSASGYCDGALQGLRRVCEKSLGKEAVKEKIKRITCGFGPSREISLKDGALSYKINFNSSNDADFVYEYLGNAL